MMISYLDIPDQKINVVFNFRKWHVSVGTNGKMDRHTSLKIVFSSKCRQPSWRSFIEIRGVRAKKKLLGEFACNGQLVKNKES